MDFVADTERNLDAIFPPEECVYTVPMTTSGWSLFAAGTNGHILTEGGTPVPIYSGADAAAYYQAMHAFAQAD